MVCPPLLRMCLFDQAQVLTCSRASLRGAVCLRVRTCR